ncbi:hypothetical protein GY45DRAFT_1316753 [Cubamyces sp. BRFM 1775]|nr:hypothetical protein GY45DRAFT_1316753 [Cubamyces sp. BRFM 1775]
MGASWSPGRLKGVTLNISVAPPACHGQSQSSYRANLPVFGWPTVFSDVIYQIFVINTRLQNNVGLKHPARSPLSCAWGRTEAIWTTTKVNSHK